MTDDFDEKVRHVPENITSRVECPMIDDNDEAIKHKRLGKWRVPLH